MTKKTKNDVFKCVSCGKKTTREAILKIWTEIPLGNEDLKRYYCGCLGWE